MRDEPRWFSRALSRPGEQVRTQVHGVEVSALTWGDTRCPTVVLIHGGAAHAHWWSFIAPLLADRYRIVAPDLSGHGDSGWRTSYGLHLWVDEVLVLADRFGGSGQPLLVGHSMGGLITALAASNRSAELAGVVLADAPLRRVDPESEEGRQGRMFSNPKVYPDLVTAQRHFHLVPPQPAPPAYIRRFVALHSLRAVDGGWTWKFDPRMITEREGDAEHIDHAPGVAAATCPVAFIVGERSSLVDEQLRDEVYETFKEVRPGGLPVAFVELVAAHHHLLLDEPLQLVAALRTLFATWGGVGLLEHGRRAQRGR